jgi:NACHT domain
MKKVNKPVIRPLNITFPSEALLQQAIARLLIRMPDITGVQILQGTQEIGKDIIFYIRGGFGESVLCACVVKNKKITGDAGKSEGARTILLQTQQAFDSPHLDASGRDVYVERVYIVTPFDLPPATISSISGRLRERAGQIIFIGGTTLLDLFKKYWPDFLADEANTTENYLGLLAKKYEEDNVLPKIASQYHLGEIDAASKKIYVQQILHREIYSYCSGDVLIKSIPNKASLSRKLSLNDLKTLKSNLGRLGKALVFLQEWNLLEKQKLFGDQGILISISRFVSSLEESWKESVRREFGIRYAEATRIEPRVGVELYNASSLITSSIRLYEELDIAISAFAIALVLDRDAINSSERDGLTTLSDELFSFMGHLDDCAHAAAEGILRAEKKNKIKLPKDILDHWQDSLMIVGAPGLGKTSFCRWHALQDVDRFNSGKSGTLPIYVPLHRLADGKLGSFKETFLNSLGKSALLAETKMDQVNRVRLYLDGLDEIPNNNRRQQVINIVRKGVTKNPKYQIILTSRDHVRGTWLNWLPKISLGGFDDAEVRDLVKKWLGSKDAERFHQQLRDTPALANLMRIPLLATLIILVFRQTKRLPESKSKLYEMFIDLLSGGWDLAKSILRESKFGQFIKVQVLTVLAGKIHEQERREFGDIEIKGAIKDVLSQRILKNWENLRDELVVDGLIIRSGHVYQFSHLSFQEFLTAKGFLGDPQPKRIKRGLESLLLGNDWWREVVRFYLGLSANPREITYWLLAEIDRVANRGHQISKDRINDVLGGVVESFPDFPIQDIIDLDSQE